jgi:ubiquitin carboxyl-terminal hydrolase 1
MGLVTPSFGRMESDGEYEREKDNRPLRLEPSTNDKSTLPPVATLLNLGNTCFMNSVLYTLRFTPGFAHLLHHLAADLTEKRLLSLGNERKIGSFLSSGSPGVRTKSLTSLTPYNYEEHSVDPTKRKTLVIAERLHELLQILHNAEQKGDLSEPFQGDAFLQALREVNPLFQGNQQQDAHELVLLLEIFFLLL